MINKKLVIMGIFALIVFSIIFISPTLTGNTIGPLKRGTSDMIAMIFVFLLGVLVSLSLKKN